MERQLEISSIHVFKLCIEQLSFRVEIYFGIILVIGIENALPVWKVCLTQAVGTPELQPLRKELYKQQTHLDFLGVCHWILDFLTQMPSKYRTMLILLIHKPTSSMRWDSLKVTFCTGFWHHTHPMPEDRIIICQIPGAGEWSQVVPSGPTEPRFSSGFGPLSICFDEMDPVRSQVLLVSCISKAHEKSSG